MWELCAAAMLLLFELEEELFARGSSGKISPFTMRTIVVVPGCVVLWVVLTVRLCASAKKRCATVFLSCPVLSCPRKTTRHPYIFEHDILFVIDLHVVTS